VASQIKHFATDIEKHAPFQTELACKLLIYQPTGEWARQPLGQGCPEAGPVGTGCAPRS